MREEQKELSKLIQNILVEEPLTERDIRTGNHLIYTQGRPVGIIEVGLGTVSDVIEGRLSGGRKGFACILPNEEQGRYIIRLNNKLEIIRAETDTTQYVQYNEDHKEGYPTGTNVNYQNQRLTFRWKKEESPDKGIITDKNAGITTHIEEGKKRTTQPGNELIQDENTEHFTQNEQGYTIIQHLPKGPQGNFRLPGYRKITIETYAEILQKISRI